MESELLGGVILQASSRIAAAQSVAAEGSVILVHMAYLSGANGRWPRIPGDSHRKISRRQHSHVSLPGDS